MYTSSRNIFFLCTHKVENVYSGSRELPKTLPKKPGESIYIHPTVINNFIHKYLPKIEFPFVLVSGDSDLTVPDDIQMESKIILDNVYLICWYSQNCTRICDKLKMIPIGLDFHTLSERDYLWGEKRSVELQEGDIIRNNDLQSNMAYANFHLKMNTRYVNDRRDCINNVPKELVFYESSQIKRIDSWNNMKKYKYVLSPHGSGLDCHRTWEALALGCIPIIKTSPLDDLFTDLPVLIVKNWSDVTVDLLDNCPIKNTHTHEKLYLNYWNNLMNGHRSDVSDEIFIFMRQYYIFSCKDFKCTDPLINMAMKYGMHNNTIKKNGNIDMIYCGLDTSLNELLDISVKCNNFIITFNGDILDSTDWESIQELSDTSKIYKRKVKYTHVEIPSKMLITGCVKDVANTWKNTSIYVDKILNTYSDYFILIIESNSSDNTVNIISKWCEKDPLRRRIYSLGNLNIRGRSERIGFCRNFGLGLLKYEDMLYKYKYLTILDLDSSLQIDDNYHQQISSCFEYENWDAMTSNRRGRYYDIWALRCKNMGMTYDCLSKVFTQVDRDIHVHSFQRIIPETSNLISCDSAFGCMAIYKISSIIDRSYDGSTTCEHISFNRGLKIFINPKLISGYTPDHCN